MTDPTTTPQRRTASSERIDLDDEASVRRWCDHFGITLEQLHEAVRAAGDVPADVREHLLRQGGSAGAG